MSSVLIVRVSAEESPSPASLEDRFTALEVKFADLHQGNNSLQIHIRTLEVRLATSEDTLINLSPTILGKHTHKSFAFFPKLPPELRRMVWKFARPSPRVLKIYQFKTAPDDKPELYSTAKVPSLLHACQESRRIAKEWYELSLRWYARIKEGEGRIYFDFSSDFLYYPLFDGKDMKHPTRSIPSPVVIHCQDKQKVRKIVLEVPQLRDRFIYGTICYSFASEAILVLDEEPMCQGSAELSDFSFTTDNFAWQQGRTLQQVYDDVSKRPDMQEYSGRWNLKRIQRAKFSGAGREG
jgi:uncharacterized coiled-coil protein SlyX